MTHVAILRHTIKRADGRMPWTHIPTFLADCLRIKAEETTALTVGPRGIILEAGEVALVERGRIIAPPRILKERLADLAARLRAKGVVA